MSYSSVFRRICALVCVVLVSLACFAPVYAQTTTNPLLDLLKFVPNTAMALQSEISYLDFRALIESRSGAADIRSVADWLAADRDSDSFGLFMAALLGISAGDGDIVVSYNRAEEILAATGVDLFAIERELTFAAPPANTTLLSGAFDLGSIEAAFLAHDYVSQPQGDTTLLCSPNGCDDGLRIDLKKIDPANPFGGKLGRLEPIFLAPGYLFNSADSSVLSQSVGLYKSASKSGSLGVDNPDYVALADYLGVAGTLLQAYLLPASFVDTFDVGMLTRLTPEQRERVLKELAADFQPIAAYSLVGIAHSVSGAEQLVTVTLVYDQEADAQAAAEILPDRLRSYVSLVARRPLLDLIEDRGAAFDGATVVESGDRYLTVLTFRAPLEGDQQIDGRYVASGILFRLFSNAWLTRDTGWLVTTLPEVK
ncbi:MAG: hypothetical protein KF726_17075 [Anaerolineae bacterium]|nr:hypothetical protein [Anaerolineae bacterium]